MNGLFNAFERWRKTCAIPMAVFALLVGSLGYNIPAHAEAGQNGKKVPNFQLTTLDNADKEVSEQLLKDRISILNVWSTDCGACKDEHLYLLNLVKNNPVTLIGIDLLDDRSTAQNFLAKDGNPYEVVIFDDKGKLSKALGVYGTPQTFIVDHQGIIRFSHLGELSDSVWHSKMHPLIESLTKDMEASKAGAREKESNDHSAVKKASGEPSTSITTTEMKKD